jgi:hypothetical protein
LETQQGSILPFASQSFELTPLTLDFAILPLDLALLICSSILLTLQLITNQATTQRTHCSTDGCAGTWCAHR